MENILDFEYNYSHTVPQFKKEIFFVYDCKSRTCLRPFNRSLHTLNWTNSYSKRNGLNTKSEAVVYGIKTVI